MSTPPRTREELYAILRTTSREEFILDQMIRLGFWPRQGEMPHDPADEIRRRGELERELQEIRAEHRRLHNEEALIKAYRLKRMEESRRKRQETKERKERERKERAEIWFQKQKKDIVYLGANVSQGLNNIEGDKAKLESLAIPVLTTAPEIAQAMGIDISRLRFLAFSRKTSTVSHYVRFKIPKKTGGERLISAPLPRLKEAQYWILNNILNKIELAEPAHGFRPARSIVSNAKPHVGAEAIINIDLKDFFPTISYRRVKGLFKSLGYSEAVATIFALICTEPDTETVELDKKTFYVACTPRHLPQGAPTSPAITNILCRRLDKRLTGSAQKYGFKYTRYADDLTFSTSGENVRNICNMLGSVESVVVHEGFTINQDKTRVLRNSRQQEVTGIVVNKKLSVPRKTLKKFRAVLFQIEKDGPEGKRWGNAKDIFMALQGFANFVYMVEPKKGELLKERVKALINKYDWKPQYIRPVKSSVTAPPIEEAKVEASAADPANTNVTVAETKPAAPEPPAEKRPDTKKWWKLF